MKTKLQLKGAWKKHIADNPQNRKIINNHHYKEVEELRTKVSKLIIRPKVTEIEL